MINTPAFFFFQGGPHNMTWRAGSGPQALSLTPADYSEPLLGGSMITDLLYYRFSFATITGVELFSKVGKLESNTSFQFFDTRKIFLGGLESTPVDNLCTTVKAEMNESQI